MSNRIRREAAGSVTNATSEFGTLTLACSGSEVGAWKRGQKRLAGYPKPGEA